MPHDYIFNRDWYERFDSQNRLREHQAEYAQLASDERSELVRLLSSRDPGDFVKLPSQTLNSRLKNILRFYVSMTKDEQSSIWAKQKELMRGEVAADMDLAEDERVEDAGLDSEEEFATPPPTQITAKRPKRVAA